ncbi:MAG TPA: hypothetical protein VLA15_05810 [Desulfurivibrionaceae bacterium]|nr:hypothetical protein [Desulfurivibrionaceae bacterium]
MYNNPEFRRNLWLEFTGHRLLAMPAVLGLLFLAVVLAGGPDLAGNLQQLATTIFIFIVWFWGSRNANAAMVNELGNHTWDQQRLSALSPWAMTWGKLFGATAYNWYGGLICLVVATVAGLATRGIGVLVTLGALAASGVLLHALALTLPLHASCRHPYSSQPGGIGWLALVLAFTFFINTIGGDGEAILWWDMRIGRDFFWLAASLFFGGCAIFAAWRVMSNALQVRTLPWAWPLFTVLLTIWLAGLGERATQAGLPFTGLLVAMAMTYLALFTEPTGPVVWRRLQLCRAQGDWRRWLEHLPIWPTTLLLAFLFALAATGSSTQALPLATGPMSFATLPPLVLALLLLRDACLFLFFALAPNPGRPVWATVLSLGVLDFLLPFSCKAAGMAQLAWYIMPTGSGNPWPGVMVITVQAAVALGLMSWRWRLVLNEEA